MCNGRKAKMLKICAKYAQICVKVCTKYAQLAFGRFSAAHVAHPISRQPGTFVTKYDDIFDQEEVLIILSTLAPLKIFRNISVF
jgi:hypothetical protein